MAISFAFTALILGAAYVNAQSSNVTTCSVAAYNQLNNKLGQNPCLIAAYARGECVGGPFTMKFVHQNNNYGSSDRVVALSPRKHTTSQMIPIPANAPLSFTILHLHVASVKDASSSTSIYG